MSHAPAPTLEELQAAVEAKRAAIRRPAEEPASAAEQAEAATAVCDRCQQVFIYPQIVIAGKVVAKRTRCDACVEADKQALLQADARQAGHVAKLATHDRETAFRAFLESIGANPWEHGHATLHNFDTTECGERPAVLSREFAAAVIDAGSYGPVRGLYLWGDTGPGKTHLVIGIVRHLIDANWRGRILFDHAAELIARIQDTYGRQNASTMDVLEKRFSAGLWILDDFGTERPSDDVVRHLTLIFARRALRPTLITSNLSPERLDAERPDLMRVLSRLGPRYFRSCEVRGRDRRFDPVPEP